MSAIDTLASDLTEIFGERLTMIATFSGGARTCVVVERLTAHDLDRCAARDPAWRTLGLDTPLLLIGAEIARALDAFPLEFSEIIATRRVFSGTDLFESLTVPKADLRRACEVQARGHVVHLREGYIAAAGHRPSVDALVTAAIAPFRALVTNAARLDGISPKALVTQLKLENFERGFHEALHAAEQLVDYVDRWSH